MLGKHSPWIFIVDLDCWHAHASAPCVGSCTSRDMVTCSSSQSQVLHTLVDCALSCTGWWGGFSGATCARIKAGSHPARRQSRLFDLCAAFARMADSVILKALLLLRSVLFALPLFPQRWIRLKHGKPPLRNEGFKGTGKSATRIPGPTPVAWAQGFPRRLPRLRQQLPAAAAHAAAAGGREEAGFEGLRVSGWTHSVDVCHCFLGFWVVESAKWTPNVHGKSLGFYRPMRPIGRKPLNRTPRL